MSFRTTLRSLYIWLARRKFVGKELEIRSFNGHIRCTNWEDGIEMVRQYAVEERRTILDIAWEAVGTRYNFYVVAGSPVVANEEQPSLPLGPLSGRMRRAPVERRTFNINAILTDPDTGVLYFTKE